MNISAKTKLVTVWTATLLIVGGITVSVWHTKSPKQVMPEPREQSIKTSEIAGDTGGYKKSSPKVLQPVQTNVASSQADSPLIESPVSEDAEMAERDTFLAELETESNSDKGDFLEEDSESTGLTPEQQQRLIEIEEELASLVAKHKSLRASILELGKIGAPRNHLRQEMRELERPMYILAFEYNRMVPGAIYPDGPIGQILEGVGWHFAPPEE